MSKAYNIGNAWQKQDKYFNKCLYSEDDKSCQMWKNQT